MKLPTGDKDNMNNVSRSNHTQYTSLSYWLKSRTATEESKKYKEKYVTCSDHPKQYSQAHPEVLKVYIPSKKVSNC